MNTNKSSFHNLPLAQQLNTVNKMKSDMAKVGSRYERLAKIEKNPYEVRKELQNRRSEFLQSLADKL